MFGEHCFQYYLQAENAMKFLILAPLFILISIDVEIKKADHTTGFQYFQISDLLARF